jgi:hypothetical protein
MAETHVITALVKKRAELAGDIENTQAALQKMILALEALDNTLLMFDAQYKIETIKPKAFRPPADWSKRGQMSRIILNILRQASEPMSARDIGLQLMLERGLGQEDQKLVRLMAKRCGVALRGMRDRGIAASDEGPGQLVLWTLYDGKR